MFLKKHEAKFSRHMVDVHAAAEKRMTNCMQFCTGCRFFAPPLARGNFANISLYVCVVHDFAKIANMARCKLESCANFVGLVLPMYGE